MTRKAHKFISHLLPLVACVLVAIVGISCTSEDEEKAIIAKAEQGYAGAQYSLGLMYAKGEGVPQDDKEAVKWYRKAAEQGYASAQLMLGLWYALGHGVPEDMVSAYAWFNVASANGNEKASESRDRKARLMTPEQIAEAQELSKVWFEKFQPKK
jgi:hypothetical protein